MSEESPILHELVASFIERDTSSERKGILWAIRYLSEKDLVDLKSGTSRGMLMREIEEYAMEAEKRILSGFSYFLPSKGVRTILSAEEKAGNIKPYIKDIAYLFSLRNSQNRGELEKLRFLTDPTDASGYTLILNFEKIADPKGYYLKNIEITKNTLEQPIKQ